MTSSLREVFLYVENFTAIALLAKTTATLVLGLASAWLARRSRASIRHSILTLTFGALLLVPLASSFAPSVKIPVAVDAPFIQTATAIPRISVREPVSSISPTPAQSSRSLSGASFLLAIWLSGAVIFLVPVVISLWQARTMRRNGLPWHDGQRLANDLIAGASVRRHIDVRFYEGLSGPVTCGVFGPVILFPPDAIQWNHEDLSRAMIHELEHVRRADRIWHVFARILCAVYWFHPLVWIAWHHLALEAEKACDDAVLARWETAEYADQLVLLGRRASSSLREAHMLSMASRTDLAARIHAMLDQGQRRGRAGMRAVILSCGAAALLIVAISAFRLVAAPQTSAPRPALRFDVVSVKPVEGATGGAWDNFPRNGMWTGKSMAIPAIVAYAYGVSLNRVEGVPKAFMGPDPGFTIVAKMPVSTNRKDFFLMMQSLLADRFKAAIHTETRDVPVNTIEVAKGGVKLQPASGQCVSVEGNAAVAAGEHRCHDVEVRPAGLPDGTVTWEYSGWSVSMADIAAKLSRALAKTGRMVDDTGLRGLYDLDVKLETHRGQDEFDSQVIWQHDVRNAWEKQAGLLIDLSKTAMRPDTVVVVDHVEYPTPN
jgi:uncharacterized protein (TIGR03435 family)